MKLYYTLSVEAYQEELNKVGADEDLMKRLQAGAKDLEEKGYCVIPSVVEEAMCDEVHNNFWTILSDASNNRLQRPQSADDLKDFKKTNNWPMNRHGIFEDAAYAHLPFVHAIRTHPAVATLFANLYHCSSNQLIVAPDRINYQLPQEWLRTGRNNWYPGFDPEHLRVEEADWLHVDQSFTRAGLHCIQGLVVIEDADQPGDASLEVVEGSHKLHASLANLSDSKRNWYKFTEAERQNLDLTAFKVVKARKGDVILWDSRVMHQGGRIRASREHPRSNPTSRFVVYVCMQPAWQPLTVKQLQQKKKIFTDMRCTSHWPLQSRLFSPPRTYGKEPPAFDFSKHFVRPATLASPVLNLFAGLTNDNTLRYTLCSQSPLLAFDASSGMQQQPSRKREREEIDVIAQVKRARLSTNDIE